MCATILPAVFCLLAFLSWKLEVYPVLGEKVMCATIALTVCLLFFKCFSANILRFIQCWVRRLCVQPFPKQFVGCFWASLSLNLEVHPMLDEKAAWSAVSPHLYSLSWVQCLPPLWRPHSDFGNFNNWVCHVMKITEAESIADIVLPRLDCCNSLLSGCPKHLLEKLHKVQNSAARLILIAHL